MKKNKVLTIVLCSLAGVVFAACVSTAVRYVTVYLMGTVTRVQTGNNASQMSSDDFYTDFSVPDFGSQDFNLPDFDIPGDPSTESESGTGGEADESSEDKNVYRNMDIGIGFDLNHNWIRYSEEMIRTLYGITEDTIDDQYATAGSSPEMFDIMAATVDGKTQFNVTVQYAGVLTQMIDEKSYAEQSRALCDEYFPKIGYENVQTEVILLEFIGGQYYAVNLSANMGTMPYYHCQVMCMLNDYAVSVTVSSQEEEEVYAVLDQFYRLEETVNGNENTYRISKLSASVYIPEKYHAYSLDNPFTEEMCQSQGITVEQMNKSLTLKPVDIIAVLANEKYTERSFEIEIKVKDDEDYGIDNMKDLSDLELRLSAQYLVAGFGATDYSILKTEAADYIVFDCELAGINQRRYATVIDGKMIYFTGKDMDGNGITEECYRDLEEIAASLKLGN